MHEIEGLNDLFLRVMGKVLLRSESNPTTNEMTGAQKRILYLLDLEGPKRMSRIAKLVGVTLPAATAVVDKLVRSQLVMRESDPDDRRAVLVALTAEGRRATAKFKQVHEQRLREVLERLDAEKRGRLIRAFQAIHDLLAEIDTTDDEVGSHAGDRQESAHA